MLIDGQLAVMVVMVVMIAMIAMIVILVMVVVVVVDDIDGFGLQCAHGSSGFWLMDSLTCS